MQRLNSSLLASNTNRNIHCTTVTPSSQPSETEQRVLCIKVTSRSYDLSLRILQGGVKVNLITPLILL